MCFTVLPANCQILKIKSQDVPGCSGRVTAGVSNKVCRHSNGVSTMALPNARSDLSIVSRCSRSTSSLACWHHKRLELSVVSKVLILSSKALARDTHTEGCTSEDKFKVAFREVARLHAG